MTAQRFRRLCFLVLGTALFALAYTQAPLYYSNQNQYFLHGLADAEEGYLARDWLARTADPTPIFSAGVEFTIRFLQPWTFHVFYAVLMGVYFVSLNGLDASLAGPGGGWGRRLLFAGLLVAVHSAALRWGSQRLFGADYPWYFQSGLAGQYVLGAMFQPSTVGVLLILAILLFVHDRPFTAVLIACAAATVHTTYLLGAGLLTFAFMVALWREGQGRRAGLLGAWAFLLVLPIAVYAWIRFRPESPESFDAAQHILAHFRIPHHCLPELWCDGIALLQIGWMILGILLVRGRLFPVLVTTFIGAAALTLLQIATGDDTLSLLFPWRISAVFMPIATAILLGRLATPLAHALGNTVAGGVGLILAAALAVAGGAIVFFQQGYQSNTQELELLAFVSAHKQPDDLYLLPVGIPNLKATTRGSLSSDFKKLAARKTDQRIVPIDLQRFRLHTGAPIFVDFKAIPYKDVDVLEWKRRLVLNAEIYRWIRAGKSADVLDELRQNRITHVVVPTDVTLDDWPVAYADPSFRVYRVANP